MRIVYVAIGDRHAGQKNGLIMPGTELVWSNSEKTILGDDILSDWSKWLWYDVWMPGIEKVKDFASKDPVIIADSGDMVHGQKYLGSDPTYAAMIDHQVQIAKMAMTPWRELPGLSAFLMVYGTGAHDWGSNSAARAVKDALAPWGYHVVVDEHIYWKQPDGFYLDLAHKGPYVGRRHHTRLNSARAYGEDRMTFALQRGKRYATIYQRGHYHRHVYTPAGMDWANKYHETHVMITPPMTGPNGYARHAASSPEVVICGFYFYEVIDGKIGEVQAHLVEKDARAYYSITDMPFYSNMIKDGGHKKRKKKKK